MAKKTGKRAGKKVAKRSRAASKKAGGQRVAQFAILKPVATEGVTFAKSALRGSEYQPILDEMKNLKAGETLPLKVPDGLSVRVFSNRLNSVFRHHLPTAPKGCKFVKRKIDEGSLGISCVKVAAE